MPILVASVDELPEPFVPSNLVQCTYCQIYCWEARFSGEANRIICKRMEGEVRYWCEGCEALSAHIVAMRSPV